MRSSIWNLTVDISLNEAGAFMRPHIYYMYIIEKITDRRVSVYTAVTAV